MERLTRVEKLGEELKGLGVLRPQVEKRIKEILQELKSVAMAGHMDDCALGAAPACTCGLRKAKDILDLYREVSMMIRAGV